MRALLNWGTSSTRLRRSPSSHCSATRSGSPLSVTEIKHLVSLTNDIDTQRSTLSQAKSLDKLAEHLAITLETTSEEAEMSSTINGRTFHKILDFSRILPTDQHDLLADLAWFYEVKRQTTEEDN